MASRDRSARVIYGSDQNRNDGGLFGRNDNRYPDRYPTDRGRGVFGSVPFDNGYKDGLEKGREDARDRDSYDPVRHSRYRSGDHGYNQRYGTKEQYKLIYREGFEDGYNEAYRGTASGSARPRTGGRIPWPF